MFIIGLEFLYSDGIGVPVNHQKKLNYYQKAAKLGNHYAMNNIGWSYEKGEG